MKKIFTFLLFALTSSILFAQEEGDPEGIVEITANGRSFQQITDSLFINLDKSQIPFGVLTDRVYLGNSLNSYGNGDTIAAETIKQVFWNAENATIPNSGFIPRYQRVSDSLFLAINKGELPLMIVDYNISSIKEDAYETGALTIDPNGFITNGDNGITPYETARCMVAGITAKNAYANFPYQFTLPFDNILSNTTSKIEQIKITNVNSGNEYILIPGGKIDVTFLIEGTQFLTIQIKYQEGITNIYTIPFEVTPSRPTGEGDCNPISIALQSKIPYKGIGESYATTTWIDYHIYYHYEPGSTTSCEPILKKPVLILDGFDPLDGRSYSNLYNQYFGNQSSELIADKLRQKGYDVIIVNFPVLGNTGASTSVPIPSIVKKETSPGVFDDVNKEGRDGGADFIERNAMAVIALIQEVNTQLIQNGSSEKLAVVGPSMGGLIARYALAYMEKQNSLGVPNMNHNTRLYLSYDSPHDGANIALGHQNALDFYGNVIGIPKAKEKLDTELLSIAAKQILIEQLDGQNNTAPYRSAFYTNLNDNGLPNSHGYPLNCRKVALTNGSGSGQKYQIEGAQVIDAWGKKVTWLFGGIKFFINQTNFMPNYGSNIRIFRGRGAMTGLLSLTVITEPRYVTNSNLRGSMDVVPGGNFDVQTEIKEAFIPALVDNSIPIANQYWNIKKGMSFIPTISALGFKNPNFNWNNRVDDRNLVCNNEIYFDNYFTPSTNEQHIADPDNNVYINNSSANWVIQEIEYGQQGCPVVCATGLNGPSSVCANQNVTYTINGTYPANTVLSWNVPSGYQTIGQSANSITVKVTGNGTLEAVLSPTLSGIKCSGDVILQKIISASPVNFNINFSPGSTNDIFIAKIT